MSEGLIGNLIVAAARRLLPKSFNGSLELTMPSGRQVLLGEKGTGPDADLSLRNFKVVWASVRRGQLGFFERYLAGDVECRDPTAFFRFYLQNRGGLDKASTGVFFASFFDKLWHKKRENSREGSKDNISAHYDLGNEFYKLWLDDTMSYSSAVFDGTGNSLEAAQRRKIEKVLEAAEAAPGKNILEIGCGWGGVAEAVGKMGARLRGITLSREQLEFAKERMVRQGVDDKVELVFEDYRDTRGTYDGIASVEMIEAVGEAHWPAYFKTLFDRLKPGGAAAIQGITILEENYDAYRNGVDFIQRYIFPGGMLLTKEIMRDQTRKAGLIFEKMECFGQSYARTLKMWHDRFEEAWPRIQPLGFDERFRKLWKLYLCYCEAGFTEGVIDVGIYKLRKPA
ncbi:MAG: class I SAM-dependent methyltransferase [Phyllobacteriaceae bacterium]|jgi:cyclopropane-fatty-acyl-phospholipid synthase|nr:class I SAM-dependent methyltransferase [Phyllobacteriaceae bacterium]